MGSDFAHVGLGSPNLVELYLSLSGQTAGLPDATISTVSAFASGSAIPTLLPNGYPADGTTEVVVRVQLLDSKLNTVQGKTVSLAANPSSHAVISSASGVSTVDNGAVIFTVTNDTIEDVTLTATDTTDNIVLAHTPTIHHGDLTERTRPRCGGQNSYPATRRWALEDLSPHPGDDRCERADHFRGHQSFRRNGPLHGD